MSQPVALLNVSEASKVFGVTSRTIFRKIKANEIRDTQIVRHGRETRIYINELVRVFGEPKKATDKQNQEHKTYRDISGQSATQDPKDAHIATLVGQLAHEQERAEREREEMGRNLREARERADRYEREVGELRQTVDALKIQLLQSPQRDAEKAGGVFARFVRLVSGR